MNKISVRLLFVIGLVGLISACTSTFKSNVSRFHELPKPQGEKVVIMARDPGKATSLEFASYANIVAQHLAEQGYVPAKEGTPDLIVELDYSVDDGKVMTRASRFDFGFAYGYHPYYSRWYSPYYPYWRHGYFYDPFWGYRSSFARDRDSYVNYTRKLNMVIRPNKEGAKNLFEGTVESKGRSNKLHQLMPHMVQALFTRFPGVSGTTEKIVIELNKD